MQQEKITIHQIRDRKNSGEKIIAVTAYDFTLARLVDEAGVDLILVGDSLANTVMGLDSTVPVTLGQMIYHAEAVMRAEPKALVVVDMPFGSVNDGSGRAVNRAVKVFKRTGADAVKIEGGKELAEVVRAVVDSGIPVVGHVGLLPQYRAMLGGLKVQGKELEAARHILEDARAIAGAGVFSIVLEAVPAPLARLISERVDIPTIGIGAGAGCDGQILVLHDILGLSGRTPKFAGRWADLGQETIRAVSAYREAVRSGGFPADEHSFTMDQAILDEL
jgi:3-methyl-2-oxobutanoate hydroxymethyltransferase